MMTTDIISEVARLVAQRKGGLKDSKENREARSDRALPRMQDAVELSPTAREFAGHGAETDYEKEQNLKVERLKTLVGRGNYRIDHAMVETIAERIADSLA